MVISMKMLIIKTTPSPLPMSAVSVLQEIWNREAPDCLFFHAGASAVELASRMAVRVGVPCISGVTGVRLANGGFLVTRPVYGGELTAEYFLKTPCLIVLDNSICEQDIDLSDELIPVLPNWHPDDWFEEIEVLQDDETGKLEKASMIIAAGRGIKSKAQYQAIVELSERLGAAAGATRPVVYNGWAPLGAQIGVSGAAVSPDVCLTMAASGSQAFLSAISKNTKIIAVNNDADAPVFRRADLGVVCDAGDLLRELLEITENSRGDY